MSVVSNASPLINLARIGKLTLLRDLYGELIVPEAVWQEVVVEGAGQPGADAVESATWIKTQAATNRQLVNAFKKGGQLPIYFFPPYSRLLTSDHLPPSPPAKR